MISVTRYHSFQKTMLYLMKSKYAIFSNIKVTKIERSFFLLRRGGGGGTPSQGRRSIFRMGGGGAKVRKCAPQNWKLCSMFSIGFPGQFRNFVDQIHFMSIQFRRFGSCTIDLSFDFIFQAFDFALTPIKSKFVSFKFAKKCSKFAKRSFNLAKNGDVIAQYCYSSIQIHFGAFYLTRWAFKFAYFIAPVDFINHN